MITQIEPWIDHEEMEQLKRVIDSTFVVEHSLTQEFEIKICELTGSPYAVAITNGTVALYCCLKALDIGPGDEVIVPNMTFIASANAVIMAGAIPVLAEIREDTFCIDVDKIKKCITPRTKAIMPVHLYGQSVEMEELLQLARKYNLKVVEDAAQGVGVRYNNRHVGTFGDLGILSFYGNKTITCGEGGIILTADEELRNKCYRLKNHGRDAKGTFMHHHIGYNFCFTEMQAAIGIAQLNKLPLIIQKKKEIHDLYCERLSGLSTDFVPVTILENCEPVFWFTSFLCSRKTELVRFLKEHGVQAREFFYPLDKQPCYSNEEVRKLGNYQSSMKVYEAGISLPSSYNLTAEDQERVITLIEGWLRDEK